MLLEEHKYLAVTQKHWNSGGAVTLGIKPACIPKAERE